MGYPLKTWTNNCQLCCTTERTMAYIDDRRRPKTRSGHSLHSEHRTIDTIKSENVNIALTVPAVESRMDDALILKFTGSLGDYRAIKHQVVVPHTSFPGFHRASSLFIHSLDPKRLHMAPFYFASASRRVLLLCSSIITELYAFIISSPNVSRR